MSTATAAATRARAEPETTPSPAASTTGGTPDQKRNIGIAPNFTSVLAALSAVDPAPRLINTPASRESASAQRSPNGTNASMPAVGAQEKKERSAPPS